MLPHFGEEEVDERAPRRRGGRGGGAFLSRRSQRGARSTTCTSRRTRSRDRSSRLCPERLEAHDLNASAPPHELRHEPPGFLSWLEERPGVLGRARPRRDHRHPRTPVAADDEHQGTRGPRAGCSRPRRRRSRRAGALPRRQRVALADERAAAFLLHERGLAASSLAAAAPLPAAPPDGGGSGADEMGARRLAARLAWEEIRPEYDATIGLLRRDFGARFGFLYQAASDEYLWATPHRRRARDGAAARRRRLLAPALVLLLDFEAVRRAQFGAILGAILTRSCAPTPRPLQVRDDLRRRPSPGASTAHRCLLPPLGVPAR